MRRISANKLHISSIIPLSIELAETDFNYSENYDVYLGYIGWAAGSFGSTYGNHFKIPDGELSY